MYDKLSPCEGTKNTPGQFIAYHRPFGHIHAAAPAHPYQGVWSMVGGVWLVVGGVWSDMHYFSASSAHPYQDQRFEACHILPHDQYWLHLVLCGSPTAGHL